MNIYPDYIDAAHEMYIKYKVGAGIRAVDILDYHDPITGRDIDLEVCWRMQVSPSGPIEVWSVILPRQDINRNDFSSNDQLAESIECEGIELVNDFNRKWHIYFQARCGIVVNARTKRDLIDAVDDCRECIEQMVNILPQAA